MRLIITLLMTLYSPPTVGPSACPVPIQNVKPPTALGNKSTSLDCLMILVPTGILKV